MDRLTLRLPPGAGPIPRVLAGAVRLAREAEGSDPPWRRALRERQLRIRRALVAEALRLGRSERAPDQAAARALERFVRTMPGVETQDDRIRRWLLGERSADVDREGERPRRR